LEEGVQKAIAVRILADSHLRREKGRVRDSSETAFIRIDPFPLSSFSVVPKAGVPRTINAHNTRLALF
jgi:hypothetical protein